MYTRYDERAYCAADIWMKEQTTTKEVRSRSLEDEFPFFPTSMFVVVVVVVVVVLLRWFSTLEMIQTHLELFWSLYQLKPPLGR